MSTPSLDGMTPKMRDHVQSTYIDKGVLDSTEIFAREAETLAAENPDNEAFQRIARDARTLADAPRRDDKTYRKLERAVLDLQHENRRRRVQRRLAR